MSELFNRRTAVIVHDLFMVLVAWLAAVIVPYNFQAYSAERLDYFLSYSLPAVLLIQTLWFWYYHLYRGVWRFASLPDLWHISKAVILGTFSVALFLFLVNRLDGIPRSALLLYPIFLGCFLSIPRLLYRVWREHSLQFLLDDKPSQRVLIIGAGRAGETLVRDMRRGHEYIPVGYLDDEISLHQAKVHGVPVLGSIEQLPHWVKDQRVELIFIALPSASDEEMQHIVSLCEKAALPFLTLPKLQDMHGHQPSLQAMREVSIEDLLGRDKIQLDWQIIEQGINGQCVLVSGGGGSIGSELCRQIARLSPAKLVIFERSEFNLYQIEMNLRRDFPHLHFTAHLGDICDPVAVQRIFELYQPQTVFHAAAYKHVPMLQNQIREAVRNNVLGTQILAEAAVRQGCQAFVMISTDKAVNPANIMGSTKRIAEMLCQNLNDRGDTRFITVRFGNVLGSAGSVVPLFQAQIAKGGPVTVTHPDITRYFMTIPEASQLILQAAAMGEGGEIFVLDMGTPIKIRFLAEQLIRLSGKQPDKDIEIVYTGLRPGEKLYEELFHAEESQFDKTQHAKILLASHRQHHGDIVEQSLSAFQDACQRYDETSLRQTLCALVPEFHDGGSVPRSESLPEAQDLD